MTPKLTFRELLSAVVIAAMDFCMAENGTQEENDASKILVAYEKQMLDMANAMTNTYSFHPRAVKLMEKRKPFVVIAVDEPYFKDAYDLIRDNEMNKGTWEIQDQNQYVDLIALWKKNGGLSALMGGK